MSFNSIYTKSEFYVNTIAFHRQRDTLLAGNIAGGLSLYSWDDADQGITLLWSIDDAHRKSIRKAGFSNCGKDVISVSADKRAAVFDLEGRSVKWRSGKHESGISTYCIIDDNTIATGDDDGDILIWDTRVDKSVCRSKCSEFSSPIAGLLMGKDSREILAICDDQLGCFSLSKNYKVALRSMSDNIEDEILTFCFMKNMKKVVCGTNTGNVCLFSYGDWGDINDRIKISTNSLDSIVAYDEDTLLVGGDDKDISMVSIIPNEVKGTLKKVQKLGLKISNADSLCLRHDKSLLGFIANFEHICIVPTDEVQAVIEGGDVDEGNFFGDLSCE
ncbi:WD G-beta repeat containing protein 55 [Babesia ovis]|uniref:WD G-beta repeat containing protein 55 n=1 Tax=Babesia ovis TaxID=5869 RepID=A0A9W5WVL0_BABOV|nr:WD G-beta repeat containing protein 55 [Babesia ovis]